jgi:ribosomal protein RSM22 (predicted rRNA methylase)
MLGLELVRPLEDDWRDALDAVARSRSWPTSRDVARLAARVAELSEAYNDPARARAAMREAGAARLGFAFARDVPKGAAAVREIVATGALRIEASLRVLDVGAGLGAMTWGLARALDAAGARGVIDATWVDEDAQALELGAAVFRERGGREGAMELRLRPLRGPLTATAELGRFDAVLLGNVLSELDVGAPEALRLARHVELVGSLLERHTAVDGVLVVVEPALRDRSRHLHRVRDALAAAGVRIFAPCLHAAPCPALVCDADWCHEDVPVDLPAWLAPVARAAGLRREGLTFSYLVLSRGEARLADAAHAPLGAARLRVVSDTMRSKGKREAFLCGELAHAGALAPARARVMRLDRDESPENAAWARLRRGDVAVIAPAPELERPRVGANATVIVVGDAESH